MLIELLRAFDDACFDAWNRKVFACVNKLQTYRMWQELYCNIKGMYYQYVIWEAMLF